jgi:phospholipid/cholesterol/gamma-HCH transport system ATP-binding protein
MPHEPPRSPNLSSAAVATAPSGPSTDSSQRASAIVRFADVWKSFGRQQVLRGLNLTVRSGRTTVILGPSGCGKSVLLKHMVGLLKPDRGEVWFEDHRIDSMNEVDLVPVRRQFGFLFQQGALFDSMSVRQNIEFPLLEHTHDTPAQRDERVRRVLHMVGLEDTIAKMPADLSGGQRKRVALARAIVLEPKIILYDEPTTGLDPIRADVINELIIKLQKALSVTSVVVTHDLASAFKVADRLVMMHAGQILFEGTAEQLRQSDNPIVRRFLLGQASSEELAAIRDSGASAIRSNGEAGPEGSQGSTP